jgi:hypothetical protein
MDSAQTIVTLGGIGLIGFTLWFFFGKGAAPAPKGAGPLYSCPMHPWITSSDPAAQCPTCGMKLVRSEAPSGGA